MKFYFSITVTSSDIIKLQEHSKYDYGLHVFQFPRDDLLIYNKKLEESSITIFINPNKTVYLNLAMIDMKIDDFDLINIQRKINIEELISS